MTDDYDSTACGSCRFFEPAVDGGHVGDCHYNPPTAIISGLAIYPRVIANARGCNEHHSHIVASSGTKATKIQKSRK